MICERCGHDIPAGQLHCLECLEAAHIHGGNSGLHLLKLQAALRLLEDANGLVLPLDTAIQAERAIRAAVEQTQHMLDRGSPLPRRRP